jgi:GYF domain 2
MASQWYVVQGNDDLGPMTTDELKRLAADGKIGPRDLVRKEGVSRWVLASAVDGLLSAPVARPSLTPAPPSPPRPVEPPPPSDLDRARRCRRRFSL